MKGGILPDAAMIRKEYEMAARSAEEYQKVRWASEKSMYSRFFLALKKLPFARTTSWLDIGCGTGAFQALVYKEYPEITCTAIDLSPALVAWAKKRVNNAQCTFLSRDFMDFPLGIVDIITCIGVLQRTNMSLDDFFSKVCERIHPNGCIFLDTKTLQWCRFTSRELTPARHLQWFTLDQIEIKAAQYGLTVLESGGFDPHNDLIVAEEESPTIFAILTPRREGK